MKKLESYILNEKNLKNKGVGGKGIEIMAKEDLMSLNLGAEITETDDDEDEEYE